MAEEEQGYAWETEYEKSWEELQEDEDGLLQGAVEAIINKSKRKRLLDRPTNVRLGMMRHMYVILDMSKAMEDQDLKPNRALSAIKLLEYFITEYLDQNPMSQLGVLVMRNKRVEKLCDLGGNRKRHIMSLAKLRESVCLGEPSLQNSLEQAIQGLRHMPSHASREILIVFGNLSTCDPGIITDTIATMKSHNIRCSIIGLGADVHVCRTICSETQGIYNVILDELHFKDILTQHLVPPASSVQIDTSLLRMGFPRHETHAVGDIRCSCHVEQSQEKDGYFCPNCNSKYCDLPIECVNCGLMLVSAPHLARSYHHLLPLPAFIELPSNDVIKQNRFCFGCQKFISEPQAYKCTKCMRVFCIDCDVFIHDTLHSCPGCASKRSTSDAPSTGKSADTPCIGSLPS